MNKQRDQWSSKLGFVMAAAGAAIGIGAIWKFPYVAGQYGGGAFLLIFIIYVIYRFTNVDFRIHHWSFNE